MVVFGKIAFHLIQQLKQTLLDTKTTLQGLTHLA